MKDFFQRQKKRRQKQLNKKTLSKSFKCFGFTGAFDGGKRELLTRGISDHKAEHERNSTPSDIQKAIKVEREQHSEASST
jgi:hypothetical protein